MPELKPVEYTHPTLGFSISFPPGSDVSEDVPGAAVMAVDAGVQEGFFRTNLVITVDAVQTDDAEEYTDAALAVQERGLRAYQLLDRTDVTLADLRGTRTLAHHDADGWAVTVEQWRVLHGGRAYTLTASASTLDYDASAEILAAAAETFRPS